VYCVSLTLPLQTYRFGNWTAGGGLNWPSQGLYMRRNNLQGHAKSTIEINPQEKLLDQFKTLHNIPTVYL